MNGSYQPVEWLGASNLTTPRTIERFVHQCSAYGAKFWDILWIMSETLKYLVSCRIFFSIKIFTDIFLKGGGMLCIIFFQILLILFFSISFHACFIFFELQVKNWKSRKISVTLVNFRYFFIFKHDFLQYFLREGMLSIIFL